MRHKYIKFQASKLRGVKMIELLRKRRSIRRFKDKPIEQEKIDILKEAALRSLLQNLHSWEFIFIDDKETIGKLANARNQSSAF